jgi:hypothetical protein
MNLNMGGITVDCVDCVEKHEAPGLVWTVLFDPAGNEFCVGTPHT